MKKLNQPTSIIILLIGLLFSMNARAQITPHEAIVQMQKGINLGNTHEPPYEGGWNNPRAEEYYFDLYKDAGFKCVRIPVRWDNYTGKTKPYEVNASWLKRIEEVADWGLERGLFVIINAHHDDWIKQNYSEANKERFDSIWAQIADHFKDKSEKLIFEVLNEPHGLTKAQNDDMHGRILSIIRKTNPTRLVIFQGHNWGGSDELVTAAIPDDDYIIGSFHSYDPYLFGLEGQGSWGSSYDYIQLENKFKKVADWSEANNIPVFLGEFGAINKGDYNSRMRHYRAYIELSYKYGFAFAAWDDGGDFRIMERQQNTWNEIKDILLHTSSESPAISLKLVQDSIIEVNWQMRTSDHDSILIQRKRGTQSQFSNLVVLGPDEIKYLDIKPNINNYYNYRIIAHYNDTTGSFSQPARIFFPEWVRPVRAYFHDTLMVVPGIIEAEDFDFGGEGLSYHDADESNIPGKYRPDEGVDIYDRLGDGYHVGNIVAGEWLEYSVNVLEEGWYNVTSHIASLIGGGKFQITVDTVQSPELTVRVSNSALNTVPVTTSLYLYPGEQIVRFTILSLPTFNLDKIVFELATGTYADEFSDYKIVAYQNQQQDLIIRTKANQLPEIMNLYTISGQLIYSKKNPEQETVIPAGTFSPGVYFIRGYTKAGRFSQKLILK